MLLAAAEVSVAADEVVVSVLLMVVVVSPDIVVESDVLSLVELLLQATRTHAAAKMENSFFIVLVLMFSKL